MKSIIMAFCGVVFLLLVFTLFGSWYTVDQGESAVLLSNGAVAGVEGPGLHLKMPFVQSVVMVSTQSHVACFWDVQSGNSCDGPTMDTYSSDQQDTQVQASVSYRVPAGQESTLYSQYGSVDAMVSRLIDQRFPAIFKDIFGQYTAQEAVQNRAKLNADTLTAMQAAVKGEPVEIESVQLTDIKFTPAYEASIEAKQQAGVEVQQQQQLLLQEQVKAQIAVTQAKGLADAKVAQAQADAQVTRLNGDAAADAIKAKGAALQNNPQIVALTLASEWNGILPTTMVPGGATPFIDVQQAQK